MSKGTESRKFSTQARWLLLDNKTLHLWAIEAATWKILGLNSWTMITAEQAGAGFPVRWTTRPRINAKPRLLLAAMVRGVGILAWVVFFIVLFAGMRLNPSADRSCH